MLSRGDSVIVVTVPKGLTTFAIETELRGALVDAHGDDVWFVGKPLREKKSQRQSVKFGWYSDLFDFFDFL